MSADSKPAVAGAARPSVLSLNINSKSALYAAFMPRLWGYLDTCLADPEMADLKTWFDANVPAASRR